MISFAARKFDREDATAAAPTSEGCASSPASGSVRNAGSLALYEAHRGVAFRTIKLGSMRWRSQMPVDAEGVALDTLLRAAESFTGHASDFERYAVRAILRSLRRAGRHNAKPLRDTETVLDDDPREDMGKVLGRLPACQRHIVTLHYGLGGVAPLSKSEIGAESGTSEEWVSSQLSSAIKSLRFHLGSRNISG